MKIVTFLLAALASTVAVLPAQAQARETGPTVHISFSDLNLRTEAGVKALDRRLAQATRAVCGDANAETQLARQRAVTRCIRVTKAELADKRNRVLARQAAPALLAERGR